MLHFILKDLQHHTIRCRVLSVRCLQKFSVELVGAAFALNVLIKERLCEWVIRAVVAAAGDVVPFFGYWCAAELDNPPAIMPARRSSSVACCNSSPIIASFIAPFTTLEPSQY